MSNNKIKIGIIGGTGLDQDTTILKDFSIKKATSTPWGDPSSNEIVSGKIDDVEVFILARHGKKHNINPTHVNYRANLWILKEFGCTHILATSACGSLKEAISPGHFGILDQYIDRTTVRGGRSFYRVAHIPQSKPFDPQLQEILWKSTQELGYTCHRPMTIVCIEGPRFSTLAESQLYQSWNADAVGMTQVPEVPLASELGLIYASLALVTDYDCWHSEETSVSVDCVSKTLENLSKKAKEVLILSISYIKQQDWTETIKQKQSIARSSIMAE